MDLFERLLQSLSLMTNRKRVALSSMKREIGTDITNVKKTQLSMLWDILYCESD